MGLRLASSRHKNKVCQQVSFCVEFARLLYMCRFLCQCGCEWLPVCVSHRLATYRGCAPPLAPRLLERLQPLCNPKLYKKKKIGWMTNISEGQRFKRYIARIDKFMFNKKKKRKGTGFKRTA